jgi:plastocyanin
MKRLFIVGLLILTSCTSNPEPGAELTLSEFSIRSTASSIQAGTTSFVVENAGEFGHTVVVSDADGNVIGASDLIQSGESVTLDVELLPGRYEFTCRIVFQGEDGGLIDHYERGMHTTIMAEH